MRLIVIQIIGLLCYVASSDIYSCNKTVLPQIKIENGTFVFDSNLMATKSVGNFLTIYYNSRGFAKALGLCFKTYGGVKHHEYWITKYLPQRICPIKNDNGISQSIFKLEGTLAHIRAVCESCREYWLHPHVCRGFWIDMREEMRAEVNNAIAIAEREANLVPTMMKSDHVVIQSRCSLGESFLCHGMYGPPAFSFYNSLRDKTIHNITIVGHAEEGVCTAIRQSLIAYLRQLVPNAYIAFHSSSVLEDFALLTRAKLLYLDMSSFGLVAGMVGTAEVHSPKLFRHNDFALTGFNYSNVLLLTPGQSKDIDISVHKSCNKSREVSAEDTAKILTWLNTH